MPAIPTAQTLDPCNVNSIPPGAIEQTNKQTQDYLGAILLLLLFKVKSQQYMAGLLLAVLPLFECGGSCRVCNV